MKKLFGYADKYIRQSSWKDLAMLKICLGAMGIVIGASLPEKRRKPALWIAGGVLAATYLPLMVKFFRIVTEKPVPEDEL